MGGETLIVNIEDGKFDTRLYFSDWRFSSAAVGMMRYFKHNRIKYEKGDIYISYNKEDILWEFSREKILDFIEEYFADKIPSNKLKQYLSMHELTEEQIKDFNETLKSRVIFKKIFGEEKYDAENIEVLNKLLEENRYDLIQETYRTGRSTYRNFCNERLLGTLSGEICRLNGYYLDLGKKKKSAGYNWNFNTFVYEDHPEFDFIPMGFTKTREAFFVNNNFSAEKLYESNRSLNQLLQNENDKPRKALFLSHVTGAQYVDYEVEIIIKNRDNDYFETMFVRDAAIEILKEIAQTNDEHIIKAITAPCKYGKDTFISVIDIVVDSIVNLVFLDPLIDKLLKDRRENNHGYLISQLIRINTLIYEGVKKDLNSYTFFAKQAASTVVSKIPANKVASYRNRLISSLTFKDYDRFCTVLLQLAAYSKVSFDFAYDLFDDFEKNKNLAYAFVNALDTKKLNNDETGGENNEK